MTKTRDFLMCFSEGPVHRREERRALGSTCRQALRQWGTDAKDELEDLKRPHAGRSFKTLKGTIDIKYIKIY